MVRPGLSSVLSMSIALQTVSSFVTCVRASARSGVTFLRRRLVRARRKATIKARQARIAA